MHTVVYCSYKIFAMTRIYPAKKTGMFLYVMLGVGALVLGIVAMDIAAFLSQPILLFATLLPILLFLWIYYDTYYTIEGEILNYKSAFIRGKIDINRIRSIEKGKTMYVGLKPALAEKGLIIKYNNFDTIYIAPEDNEELIADLLAINSGIVVI